MFPLLNVSLFLPLQRIQDVELLLLTYFLLTLSITFFYNIIIPFVADSRYGCQHVQTVRAEVEIQILIQRIFQVPSGFLAMLITLPK